MSDAVTRLKPYTLVFKTETNTPVYVVTLTHIII